MNLTPRDLHVLTPPFPTRLSSALQVERRLRRAAAARGFNEAVTWSFLPMSDAEHFADGADLWVLENPISDDMRAMRPSLLPGLIAAARRNADRSEEHTSELQSLMRTSYAVFRLKTKNKTTH